MNIFRKNEKGISLISLIIIIALAIVAIFWLYGGKRDSNSNGNRVSSTNQIKEDRSTYISKCTTIDYNSLARNPNLYRGNFYTFTGKVIQAMNESNSNNTVLRVNVTAKRYEYLEETYYDDTILVNYNYSSNMESRILEDDIVTIYGQFMGTYTYESIVGMSVTVPSINAEYININ